MPKRRRKNDYDDEEVEGFSFIDIPTAATTSIKPTVSETRVINVVEWNIDGNRVSTSNTLTTSIIEKTPVATSDGRVEPHADYDQLEYEFPNDIPDMPSTNTCVDPQSASNDGFKHSARTLIVLTVILVLIFPTGLPYAFLAQRN